MTWTGTHNDLTAVPEEGHVLRVEEMSTGVWWWSAVVGSNRISSDENGLPGNTKQVAKKRAEYWYRKLLKNP
jgi:hypothetical protein